jgi:hypothetical protein
VITRPSACVLAAPAESPEQLRDWIERAPDIARAAGPFAFAAEPVVFVAPPG